MSKDLVLTFSFVLFFEKLLIEYCKIVEIYLLQSVEQQKPQIIKPEKAMVNNVDELVSILY